MNIWLISKYASPPKYTKAPSRLFFLAREFVKQGNEVTLITSDSNHFANYPQTSKVYNNEEIDGVAVNWLKTKKYTKTTSLSRILSWFDFERKLFGMKIKGLERPDVIIISSLSIFSIVYGCYLKRKYKAFLVFEIRDIWPLTLTAEGGFSKWHPFVVLVSWIEKFGYKRADLMVGTMPKLDLHVKNILGYEKPFFCSPLGFNPEDYLHVVVNSVENTYRKLASEGKVVVGYAGSMGITNALENFIETIKLSDKKNNLHFLLVGSGDLRTEYEHRLRECSNVTFLPRIPQNEVKVFLENCDILYLSTHHSEVWMYGQSMNKVVEYMLAAKPIIATYSGYPSMINEAECGVFVNVGKPEDLLSVFDEFAKMSDEERRAFGNKGRKWIFNHRKYSHLAIEYLSVINKMLHH